MVYCLLYIKRSFSQNFRKHISLYLILTCSFLLPLLVSTYRDSSAYGLSQSLLAESKGQTFHIFNVTEDDCRYFKTITGLSEPVFEDNVIYLRIENEEEWKNADNLNAYGNIVLENIESIGKNTVIAKVYDFYSAQGVSTDSDFISAQNALICINIILIILASLIVQSSYQSHLRYFSSDMRTLSYCGANKQQITVLFLVEFVIVFIAASISSILISAGILKTLFWFFLEVREVPGLAWVVFHMDVKNTLIHLLVYFLSLGVVLCFSLKQFHNHSQTSIDYVLPERIRKRKIRITRSPVLSLAKLWYQRTNNVYRSCLCVSIPLISIFLFLFTYLMLNMYAVGKPSQYEIEVSCYLDTFHGFTAEDVSFVESMEDVLYVDEYKVISPDEYVMETEDGMIIPTRLLPLSNVVQTEEAYAKNEVAVSGKCLIMDHYLGEQIKICKLEGIIDTNYEFEDITYDLVVTNILDADTVDWAVDIYLNEDLFSEILQSMPSREMKIKLKNINNHQLVEQNLREHFSGAEYEIINNQVSVEFIQSASSGLYLLFAYIFTILYLLVLVILYVKLYDYVNDCMDMINILHILGAEKKVLYLSFMKQATIPAFLSASIPVVISFAISWLVANSLGITLPMDVPIIFVYGTAAMLVAVVFVCPVHFTLRRNMREF